MQGLGERVAGVAGLLHVECDVDGLQGAAPLAVHLPAGQLLLQTVLVNAQQERRERQDWRRQFRRFRR